MYTLVQSTRVKNQKQLENFFLFIKLYYILKKHCIISMTTLFVEDNSNHKLKQCKQFESKSLV